jgi:hypothetical protein
MRKRIITIAVLIIAIAVIFSMAACKPPAPPTNNNNQAIVAILPDLLDCGQEEYLTVPKKIYAPTVLATQTQKIVDKQQESRDDYRGDSEWSNDNYYAFEKPYFDDDDNWIEDDATTVTKILCYSEAEDIIERMALAGIDEDRMIELVEYITRDDSDYDELEKGDLDKYPLTRGDGSAILDYDNLDEISDIRDNFDDYKLTDGDGDNTKAYGQTEEFWEDLAKFKKRKINSEIYQIFDNEADMFARFQMEYMNHQIQVVSEVMIPAYKANQVALGLFALGDDTPDNNLIDTDEFKDYMREELFDIGTLSYFLAFADLTLPTNSENYWRASSNNRKKAMTLYGYTYQYEKKEHEVFDDSVMVGSRTEYEDYLFLGHKDYFTDGIDGSSSKGVDIAVRFTEYDRRSYREAYRYSASFYNKYYTAQYEFQSLQEARDREVYTDSVEYLTGIGYAANSEVTYTDEMIDGLALGFAESLKISDVNYEYTGVYDNVNQYNKRNTDWNSLTDSQKDQRGINAIKEVMLQYEQLESQHYTITHDTITSSDLIKFLQYQIKSYSADYVRAIQDNKKEQVINRRKLQRAFQYFDHVYIYTEEKDAFINQFPEIEEQGVVEEKIEDLGRTKAMYVNLNANYSGTDIESQITRANAADWPGIASNMAQTLSIDYERYNPQGKYYVDEYFEDQLIKRVWDCGGTDDECGREDDPYDGSDTHMYDNELGERLECERTYDLNWALSRLLNEHEKVFRHMSGQIEVEFKKVSDFTDYYDIEKQWGGTPEVVYLSSEIQEIPKKQATWASHETDTVDPGDEISTVVLTGTGGGQKPNYQLSFVGTQRYQPAGENNGRQYFNSDYCYYEFDAWCVDEALLYEVRPEDSFRFDIRLYPRYKVINKVAPGQ